VRDRLGKALRALYQKELSGIRVPPIPESMTLQRRLEACRVAGHRWWSRLGWSAAACLMAAGLLAVSLCGGTEGGLARLITETGKTYEWRKYLETGNEKKVDEFVDAFTRHF